jgi:hypothetical protein
MRLVAARLFEQLTHSPAGRRSRYQLTDQLVEELTARPRAIVIDEAQRLTSECIELLRYLHDHHWPGSPLILVGGDGCWEVLSRRRRRSEAAVASSLTRIRSRQGPRPDGMAHVTNRQLDPVFVGRGTPPARAGIVGPYRLGRAATGAARTFVELIEHDHQPACGLHGVPGSVALPLASIRARRTIASCHCC